MKACDLVLVIPPVSQVNYPYIAVPLLSAVATQNGFSVRVVDANIQLLEYLGAHDLGFQHTKDANRINDRFLSLNGERIARDFTASWVEANAGTGHVFGFNVSSPTALAWSLTAGDALRRAEPTCRIVFGGAFCDAAVARYILRGNPKIDCVVTGEGEQTLLDILSSWTRYDRPFPKNIPGTAYRSKAGEVVFSPPRQRIAELDTLPFPDYSAIPLDKYLNYRASIRALPVLGSRGCFGRCSFCSERSLWGGYRVRSAESVVAEIKHQCVKHRLDAVRFNDSVVIGNYKRLDRMCDLLIEADLGVVWVGNARIDDRLTYPVLEKMYRSGCRVLWFGMESASERILQLMKKDIDVGIAGEVLQRTHDVGIEVLTFWIANFPGEHLQDVRRTINFLRSHGKNIDFVHFTGFHLHKKSEMARKPADYGIDISGLDRFGNPIWKGADSEVVSADVLKGVSQAYLSDRQLRWNFVGMV